MFAEVQSSHRDSSIEFSPKLFLDRAILRADAAATKTKEPPGRVINNHGAPEPRRTQPEWLQRGMVIDAIGSCRIESTDSRSMPRTAK